MRGLAMAILLMLAAHTAPSGKSVKHSCLQPENICIVTSLNVATKTLTFEDLYSIYTLFVRYWDSGGGIRVATLRGSSPTYREFVHSVLGTTTSRYERDIRSKLLGGRTQSNVKLFDSEFELLEYVSTHNNVIGYVSHEAFDDFEATAGFGTVSLLSVR